MVHVWDGAVTMTTLETRPLQLTPRQREVVGLRLRRLGRREIAHLLGIQPRTVRSHLDVARLSNGFAEELDLLLAADRDERDA